MFRLRQRPLSGWSQPYPFKSCVREKPVQLSDCWVVSVMVWSRKDGSSVSAIMMLRIGAASNGTYGVSKKVSFLDTMSLSVGIAVCAEQMLLVENTSCSFGLLTGTALSVILAKSGAPNTDLSRTAKTFSMPENILRHNPDVYRHSPDLWYANAIERRAALYTIHFCLTSFGKFSKLCRAYVLLALHKLEMSQSKLTAICADALDKAFSTDVERLITAVTDLWRNDTLPHCGMQGTERHQMTDHPKSVRKCSIFGNDDNNIGGSFVETAATLDVTLNDKAFSFALDNTPGKF